MRLVGAVLLLASWSCSESGTKDAALDGKIDMQVKADVPKADAPKADAPKADMPKADMPKADMPNCVHPSVVQSCSAGYCSIPAGCFTMGSPASEPCRQYNEDQHQVTLTHGFEIADHEVTQGEFLAQMGYNPSFFTTCGTSCPVETVSWHESAAYCNRRRRGWRPATVAAGAEQA